MIIRWLPVVGYPSYEVSELGQVRSVDRVKVYESRDHYSGKTITVTRHHRGRLLRPGPKGSGHLTVVLGRGNTRTVHRLVLEAFVGPCPPGCESRHYDDNPANNRLTNLRWGTRSENLHDAMRNGKKPIGEKVHNAKLSNIQVVEIKKRINNRPKYPVGKYDRSLESFASIGAHYGVSGDVVRMIARGRTWRHFT
jgi:hypothetical protein